LLFGHGALPAAIARLPLARFRFVLVFFCRVFFRLPLALDRGGARARRSMCL
jgi:hypothetical protein